jgi:hypothetical protein
MEEDRLERVRVLTLAKGKGASVEVAALTRATERGTVAATAPILVTRKVREPTAGGRYPAAEPERLTRTAAA